MDLTKAVVEESAVVVPDTLRNDDARWLEIDMGARSADAPVVRESVDAANRFHLAARCLTYDGTRATECRPDSVYRFVTW